MMKPIRRKNFLRTLERVAAGSFTLDGVTYCGISRQCIHGLNTVPWHQNTYSFLANPYYTLMERNGVLGEETTAGELEARYNVDLHTNSGLHIRAVNPERLAAVREAVERSGTYMDPDELAKMFEA